ncbi:MAG: hypothetical protein JXA66_01180, partial [Oligoflexia bacterium]|nr:hypothetical protein [Oligoflexia bacterium]
HVKINRRPVDLNMGNYEFLRGNNSYIMQSTDKCRETGLQVTREIKILDGNIIELADTVTNLSNKPATWDAWEVSEVRRPASVKVYMDMDELIPYEMPGWIDDNKQKKERLVTKAEKGWINLELFGPDLLIFGGMPNFYKEAGKDKSIVRIEFPDTRIVWYRTFKIFPDKKYAHRPEKFKSVVEFYNSDTLNYFEAEVHSPIKKLAKGQSVTLKQTWFFYKSDDIPVNPFL